MIEMFLYDIVSVVFFISNELITDKIKRLQFFCYL